MGYSPRGRKESDTAERLLFAFEWQPACVHRGAHVHEDQQVPAIPRVPEHEQSARLLPVLLQLGPRGSTLP